MFPDEDQKQIIIDTFVKFNEACNFASEIAWEKHLFNKVFLQRIVYRDIRDNFGLASQFAVRVIGKVVETYKADRAHCHKFNDFGSIVYDPRILSFKGVGEVSINTVR